MAATDPAQVEVVITGGAGGVAIVAVDVRLAVGDGEGPTEVRVRATVGQERLYVDAQRVTADDAVETEPVAVFEAVAIGREFEARLAVEQALFDRRVVRVEAGPLVLVRAVQHVMVEIEEAGVGDLRA